MGGPSGDETSNHGNVSVTTYPLSYTRLQLLFPASQTNGTISSEYQFISGMPDRFYQETGCNPPAEYPGALVYLFLSAVFFG